MSSALMGLRVERAHAVYPERLDADESAWDAWARVATARLWYRLRPLRSRLTRLVAAIDAQADDVARLDDQALQRELSRMARAALTEPYAMARTFAVVREAAQRSLGLRPFGTQLMGAAALFAGRLAEMPTGEGKTLTAALAACVAAGAGVPVHVVTVNDYLAQRDAASMGRLFGFFGLKTGAIVSGMSLEARRAAYACDITYCTNKELVFDYLKDRVAAGGRTSLAQHRLRALCGGRQHAGLLLRGLHFAIVDEADSVLIDEARTPLILAEQGSNRDDPVVFARALALAAELEAGLHFELSQAQRVLQLTPAGRAVLAERSRDLGATWAVARNREQLVAQALRALHLFRRDQQYLVADGKVHIVDEYTGRVLPGRTWEQGLHQMIETKEGCELSVATRTQARITYQRFFRRYLHLAGMTGTAREVRGEILAVYGLDTVTIPPNKPCRREYLPTLCCADEADKWRRVAAQAATVHAAGRPVLIGTRSVEASERLSAVLATAGLVHQVLNARQDADEAAIVERAGQCGAITVATNMAGRGTDIPLGPGVDELGGLHVILTEYHDTPRIDRQLLGRCARQGNRGSVQAIVALDDALFRTHGGALLRLLRRFYPHGQPPRWLLLGLRRQAQGGAERIHRRVRRDTLKQDRKLDASLAFAGNAI